MRIAFLGTGSELISGEVIDTNTPEMAQQLHELGAEVTARLLVGDEVDMIREALAYLSQRCDLIITVGGLGPTSDDLTRHGIAQFARLPLEFSEPTWQAIVARIQGLGLPVPESNRQQAYFPRGAHLLANPSGTALGCWLQQTTPQIIMLPGPPVECLPMFVDRVLPVLKQQLPKPNKTLYRWRTLGVSESVIAEQIDSLAKPARADTAYRICFPYLEIKVLLPVNNENKTLIQQIETLIAPHRAIDATTDATVLLRDFLKTFSGKLLIHDYLTHGRLEAKLSIPETSEKIFFGASSHLTTVEIILNGLAHYWQQEKALDAISIEIKTGNHTETKNHTLPYHHSRAAEYATEYAAQVIYHTLTAATEEGLQ